MAKGFGSQGGSDRRDGRLLRTLDSFARYFPFFMPSRGESFDFYEECFDITPCSAWIKAQRSKGYSSMSFLHLLIAAYIRVISALPGLNRFVAGRRVYARNGIDVTVVVRRGNEIDAPTAPVKVSFEPSDTVYEVYSKLNDKLESLREEDGNDATLFAVKTGSSARLLAGLYLRFLAFLDRLGFLPQRLERLSPLHSSVMISDMRCMGITPMHHHVHELGSIPVYISCGAAQRTEEKQEGKTVERRFIELRFSLDSRTVSPSYYAAGFKLLGELFADPGLLEVPPVRVHDDIY
ncbi:MAG: hypothetical protein HUJ66_07460 [Oscillospiraceae bacterium]|nr:hypothetical protein [Oscillospiraceae bacterium]